MKGEVVKERARPVVLFSLLSLFLVVLNFVFDVWRRYDFASEKHKVLRRSDEVQDLLSTAHMFLRRVNVNSEQLTDRFRVLDESLAFVETASTRLLEEQREVPSPAQDFPETLVGEEPRDFAELSSLQEIVDAPVKDLLARFRGAIDTPLIRDRFFELRKNKWGVAETIAEFENEYGFSLTPKDTRILRFKIEAYQHAAASARSQYKLGLSSSTAQRIADGDYTSSGPKRKSKADDTLSVLMTGRHHLEWSKADYPDLHRLDVLWQYIPAAMIEEVYTFFDERSSR